MKKRIFMALLAAVSAFVMIGCGKDDKDDDPTPAKVSAEAKYTETDNSVVVQFPDDKTNPTVSYVYTTKFDGDKVTEYTVAVVCKDAVTAKAVKAQFDADPEVKEVKQDGNTVTVVYNIDEEDSKDAAILAARLMGEMMGCEGVPEVEI